MKNKFSPIMLATLFASITITSHAQFTCFEAEGFLYNEANDGNPGSSAEFYSKPWGGHVMHTNMYNLAGKVIFKSSLEEQPAFVINTLKSKGNGRVMFIEEKDFTFDHLSIDVLDMKATVKWEAAIKENINLAFVVQQSTDGKNFIDLMTIEGKVSDCKIGYEGDLGECNPSMIYRIKIMDLNAGSVRYTSSTKMSPCSATLLLFPSVSSSTITVVYKGFIGNESYQIIDVKGNVLKNGQLQTAKTQFEISQFPAGIYFFHVISGSNRTTEKFIKN